LVLQKKESGPYWDRLLKQPGKIEKKKKSEQQKNEGKTKINKE